MRNILIVVPHLRKGGPIDVVYNLCRQIQKDGDYVIKLLTLRCEGKNSKMEDFLNLGICIKQLNCSYLQCELNQVAIRDRIQKIIDREKIDIIHCHGYHSVLVCSKLVRVRKVSTLHNRANEDFINVYGPVVGNYMLKRYFSALKRFDANIVVSKSAAEIYQIHIPNVRIVNNGIDTDRYFPINQNEKVQLRKKLRLPEDETIWISTGRIEKEKRYEQLIEWFGQNLQAYDLILLILGDGSQLSHCKTIVKHNHQIVFTGRVSNVDQYLKCADIYISNSKSEGMSMAVCEGISCGLFPVLSDIPSHRDIAEELGGILFCSVTDLDPEKILSIDIDARNKQYEYINRHFSMTAMGKGYLNYYNSLIS